MYGVSFHYTLIMFHNIGIWLLIQLHYYYVFKNLLIILRAIRAVHIMHMVLGYTMWSELAELSRSRLVRHYRPVAELCSCCIFKSNPTAATPQQQLPSAVCRHSEQQYDRSGFWS
jgi:hypothetical protein